MERVKIDIIGEAPVYATEGSVGADLRAKMDNPILLGSLDRRTIPTGIKIALPDGFEAQVRARSGLASKHGIMAVTGSIDTDYRGEIGVTLINLSNEPYRIMPNDRIGQLVVGRVARADWNPVEELSGTSRGEGGFGHTGR